MDIVLKVSTDVLKQKSLDVESEIKVLESHINEIRNILNNTGSYWVGISGDKARQEFKNQQSSTDLVLKRFKEHPSELRQMAGIYEACENELKALNQSLSTDIIV